MADSGRLVPDGPRAGDRRGIGTQLNDALRSALDPKASGDVVSRYQRFLETRQYEPGGGMGLPGEMVELVPRLDRLVVSGRLHVLTAHLDRMRVALNAKGAGLTVLETDDRIGVSLASTDLELTALGQLVQNLRTSPEPGTEPISVGFDDVAYEAVVIVKPIVPHGAGGGARLAPGALTLRRPTGTGLGANVVVGVIDGGYGAATRTDGWFDNVKPPEEGTYPLNQADPSALDPGAGHGTFVTGIIASKAPDATILQYLATDSWGFGSAWRLKDKILQAVDDGCHVINISLGFEDATLIGSPGISAALHTVPSSVLVVAAAGNAGSSTPMLPASHKAVIGVGGLAADLDPVSWSNRGPWVDVSTVAVPVLSTFVPDPGNPSADPNPFAYWAGTSFAAPKVTGELAVLLGAGRSPVEAVQELRARAADPMPHPDFGSLLDLPDVFRT